MSVYSLFAGILDYPERSIAKSVCDGLAELAVETPDAYAQLMDFQTGTAQKSLGQLQELYTSAFDLRPECTPNLGYHLFGDDARRGVFLAELKGRMEALGILLGTELPDHIALILRYLDLAEGDRLPLIEDCLLPAVSKMAAVLEPSGNPYEHALRALLSLLRHRHAMFDKPAEAVES